MSLVHLEVLVEEPSMEVALGCLLPRLLGSATFRIHVYNGKAALLRRLPERLRAYRTMLQPGWRILVLLDGDGDDCRTLKQVLERYAAAVDLMTKTSAIGQSWLVLNRIAIEELEAWYFGDWRAVLAAYPRVPSRIPLRAAFRHPDAIKGGTWEAFDRILRQAGYYPDGINKLRAAQRIAPHMDPARNTSRSFQVFRDALLEAARA